MRNYQGGHGFRETRGANTASLDSRGSEDAARPRTASAAELEIQAGLRDEAANLLTHTPMVIPTAEATNQDTTTTTTITAAANDGGVGIDTATSGSLGHIDPVTGMIRVPATAVAGPSEATRGACARCFGAICRSAPTSVCAARASWPLFRVPETGETGETGNLGDGEMHCETNEHLC